MEIYRIVLEQGTFQPYTGNGFPGQSATLHGALTAQEAKGVCEEHYVQHAGQTPPPLYWEEDEINFRWVATLAQ